MSKLQKLLVLISTILLVTILGCSAWQNGLTPAYIDPAAIEYSEMCPKIFTPYTSLWDAYRIQRGLNYQYFLKRIKLGRLIEDNDARHKFLNNAHLGYMESSEELRDTLFSPTGPLSILFAAIPGLAIGGYLIQRPSDKKRIIELENGNHA